MSNNEKDIIYERTTECLNCGDNHVSWGRVRGWCPKCGTVHYWHEEDQEITYHVPWGTRLKDQYD